MGENRDTLTWRRWFHFGVAHRERMSIVKDYLRQQDESFISLRETLELLASAGDGCNLDEAAKLLLQILEEPDAIDFKWRRGDGVLFQYGKKKGADLLWHVFVVGRFEILEDDIPI